MKLLNKFFSILFFSILIIIYSKNNLYPLNNRIILLTADSGLLISEDNANSWKKFNKGLPPDFIPVKIKDDGAGTLYLLTRDSGIYKYSTTLNSWKEINSDLFREPSINLKSNNKYRRFSAFAASSNGDLVVATGPDIFKKEAGGPWKKIIGNHENYFTALGTDSNKIFAGSSNNGIFVITESNRTDISTNLPAEPYSANYSFREEISQIAFGETGTIYLGMDFGGGIYVTKNNGKFWQQIEIPFLKNKPYDLYDMKVFGNSLFVSTSEGLFEVDKNAARSLSEFNNTIKTLSGKRKNLSVYFINKSGEYPSIYFHLNDYQIKKNPEFQNTARDIKAIYTNIYSLNKKLDSHINTIKKCGLNAIVIDLKDDWGTICFPSKNKTAGEIGAVKKYADIKKVLSELKKENIYTIARVVVFKDKYLYNAYNHKYAIWDKQNNLPWKGNPKEFWNDPYSDFVRNYNIEIAEEIEDLGFNEIQFDYIRFPSDGAISGCLYRHKNSEEMYKAEILAAFLEQAKSRIKIPVSIDIYGFNAWFRMSHMIGQDAERFAEIVDILCPMVYPSHYGRNFYLKFPAEQRPNRIVFNSVSRAVKISGGNAFIRPYLQAFKMMSPTWGAGYITGQVKAAVDSSCNGYTFWNASGNYDMLIKALSKEK